MLLSASLIHTTLFLHIFGTTTVTKQRLPINGRPARPNCNLTSVLGKKRSPEFGVFGVGVWGMEDGVRGIGYGLLFCCLYRWARAAGYCKKKCRKKCRTVLLTCCLFNVRDMNFLYALDVSFDLSV